MHYLKLIRYPNLLFIAFTQIVIKYGLFLPFEIDITLNAFGFSLLVISTMCIAAGGYIINDIYDVDIDKINKPKNVIVGRSITEKTANRLYIIFNVLGVGIGFYLANMIGKPGFAAIFIIISALLYLYSSYLKGILLVGNLLISALVAFSLIIIPLFDLLPAITDANRSTQSLIFSIILDYSLFAFFINFIREIIKDIQDINGDKKNDLNTLAISIGRKRTTNIVFGLGVLAVVAIVFYMYTYLYENEIAILYFLFLILAPMLYFCFKSFEAKSAKDYAHQSILLKIIMFLGVGSLLIYQL